MLKIIEKLWALEPLMHEPGQTSFKFRKILGQGAKNNAKFRLKSDIYPKVKVRGGL